MSALAKFKSNKMVKDNIFIDRETEYISTGSLALNILFSGKLDGGIVKRKVMQIAAISSSGKTFISMKLAKNAQRQGMDVVIVDTEFAYDNEFAKKVGLDLEKTLIIQTNSIEEAQHMVMSSVSTMDKAERDNLLIIIDSWGMMVTSKSVDDVIAGKDVRDMTKAQKKNEFAHQLAGLKTTVFVVNHVYESMNQYDPLSIPGGTGLYFVCSSIVLGSSKAKDKNSEGEVDGVIITASTKKGRFCKEFSKLKFLIQHNGGIHPYYGIMEDALEGGYVVKPNQGFYTRPCVDGDKKWRESEIWRLAQEFWTPILRDTDFKKYIEDAYMFKGEIHDVSFEEEIAKLEELAGELEDEN